MLLNNAGVVQKVIFFRGTWRSQQMMAPSRKKAIILYSAHYMSALHERWPKGLVPHEILTLPGWSHPCSKTLKPPSPQYSHRQQFGKEKKRKHPRKVMKGNKGSNKRLREGTRRHVGQETEVQNVQLSWMKVALFLEFVCSFSTWSRFIWWVQVEFWGLKGTTFQSGGVMRDLTIWRNTIWLHISQKLLYSKLYSTFKGTEAKRNHVIFSPRPFLVLKHTQRQTWTTSQSKSSLNQVWPGGQVLQSRSHLQQWNISFWKHNLLIAWK